METRDRITMLREKSKMTKKELSEIVHVAPSLVSEWERGTRGVRPEHLARLADYFNVSIDWLMGRATPQESPPSAPTVSPNMWPAGLVVKIPVLGSIRAGDPFLAEELIESWEEVPSTLVKDGDHYFLRVKGNSMIGARIADTDLVLVRRQPTVEDGEIAVVMVNGDEAVLRRVNKRNGQVVLTSENPDYKPILVYANEVTVLGKVVKIWVDPK